MDSENPPLDSTVYDPTAGMSLCLRFKSSITANNPIPREAALTIP